MLAAAFLWGSTALRKRRVHAVQDVIALTRRLLRPPLLTLSRVRSKSRGAASWPVLFSRRKHDGNRSAIGGTLSSAQTRRRLLATLSSAAAASAFGDASILAQDAPPETTTIRIANTPGICVAPQYVAEELLRIEGFSDVRYLDVPLNLNHRAVGSDVDFGIGFVAQYIVELDLGTPLVLLSGVHVGCFELFGTKRVNSIRDLKG